MQEISDQKEFYKNFSNDREFAGDYKHFDLLQRKRFMNTFGYMNNIILRKAPKNVLDVGCGNGVNLPFSNLYPHIEYHAVDYAEKTVATAQKTFPKAKVTQGDAFNLDVEDNTYDMVILSAIVILYQKEEDRLKIISEAKRVLKNDGVIAMTLWKESFFIKYSMLLSRFIYKLKGYELPMDICGVHLSESEVKKMVRKIGLKINNVEHSATEFGLLETVKYLNGSKYRRNFGNSEKKHQKIKLNVLEDLAEQSKSNWLPRCLWPIKKIFPNSFSMFSVYTLTKA